MFTFMVATLVATPIDLPYKPVYCHDSISILIWAVADGSPWICHRDFESDDTQFTLNRYKDDEIQCKTYFKIEDKFDGIS